MIRLSAIVLAAGRGMRFKSTISKPLARINSKPILIYCLEILNKHPAVSDIIVVANDKNSKEIIKKISQYRIGKVRKVVRGGARRQDSVACALSVIDRKTDFILIHDGARPFIKGGLISSVIKEAYRCGAAIVGVPVKATIKKLKAQSSKLKSKLVVEKTINRNNLWEIQTPQVFRADLILRAYEKFSQDVEVTDDSMLVEKLGEAVSVVRGSYSNIKITTPQDLILAEAICKSTK